MNSTITRFYGFLHEYAVWIEITLLLLSFGSILLYYFNIPNSDLIVVRSVNLGVILYFFFKCFDPFAATATDYKITAILPRIIALGFTLPVLGALFKLMNYPGQAMMLKFGAVSMSIAALIAGSQSHKYLSNYWGAAITITLTATAALVLWFL